MRGTTGNHTSTQSRVRRCRQAQGTTGNHTSTQGTTDIHVHMRRRVQEATQQFKSISLRKRCTIRPAAEHHPPSSIVLAATCSRSLARHDSLFSAPAPAPCSLSLDFLLASCSNPIGAAEGPTSCWPLFRNFIAEVLIPDARRKIVFNSVPNSETAHRGQLGWRARRYRRRLSWPSADRCRPTTNDCGAVTCSYVVQCRLQRMWYSAYCCDHNSASVSQQVVCRCCHI